MHDARRSYLPAVLGLLALVLALALLAGGAWLIALGGSWYYALAGFGLGVTGVLLLRGRPSALWVHAAILAGTLGWALWEAGLDWWPLATRGGLPVVLGLLLLLPPVMRRLAASPLRGGGLALAGVLAASMAVAATSWFSDPHRIEGRVPSREMQAATLADTVPPGEWHAYGRTAHGQRYSPLEQITPANVAGLRPLWSYRTGDVRGQPWEPKETTFQVTPLKIGNGLYLCTPHQAVIALDATTGREIWRHETRLRDNLALQHLTCRGLAWNPGRDGAAPRLAEPGRSVRQIAAAATLPDLPVAAEVASRSVECDAMLYMPTADGRLIALDPASGGVCRNFGGGTGQVNLWANMPNVRPGAYYSTSPPVVARGVIVVGGTVLDNVSTQEQSGVIRGYDAATGDLLWNWDPAEPRRTEPIPPLATYTPNSPNAWAPMSADPELGLVYVPLGNQPPDQWGGRRGPDVERYSSSVTALDLRTGGVRWSFQTVHHDLWDYDVPAQPTLVDLTLGGQRVSALVQPTKQGEIFVLDRRDGRPLLPVREVPVPQGAAQGDHTAPTQPVSALSFDPPPLRGQAMWGVTLLDQLACRIQFHRLRYEGRYTPPSIQGSLIHPGNFGVFNWGGIAVDPRRGILFGTPTYLAFVSRLVPRPDDTSLVVNAKPPTGSLPALNENFGAPFAAELKPFLSLLGLPCQAPPWGYVTAADLTTGEIVWMHKNGTVRDMSPVPLPFRLGVPGIGGPLVTAGGVAFYSGAVDDYVRAYDVATGRQIWEERLPAGGQATPMTYTDAQGRQVLLVMAGGHGSLGTTPGDHVLAYALPSR